MNITATWEISDEYFQMFWSDWVLFISRWRRFTIWINLAVIATGATCWVAVDDALFASAALIAFGLISIGWHFWDKSRWLSNAKSTVSYGGKMSMRFLDNKVVSKGLVAESQFEWRAFERAVEGRTGLFLRLQKGMHIYVPYDALDPHKAVVDIVARVNQRDAAAQH
jgi:hypothetical protein